jgi:hypothetical protein
MVIFHSYFYGVERSALGDRLARGVRRDGGGNLRGFGRKWRAEGEACRRARRRSDFVSSAPALDEQLLTVR